MHQNGTRFVTAERACRRRDRTRPRATTRSPGTAPPATSRRKAFASIDKGDTIIFTGNADMLLNGARRTAAETPRRRPCRRRWPQLAVAGRGRRRRPAAAAGRRGSEASRRPRSRKAAVAARSPPRPRPAHAAPRRTRRAWLTAPPLAAGSAWPPRRSVLLFRAWSPLPASPPQLGLPGSARSDDGPIADPGRFRDRVAAERSKSISPAAMPSRRAATTRCMPTR